MALEAIELAFTTLHLPFAAYSMLEVAASACALPAC